MRKLFTIKRDNETVLATTDRRAFKEELRQELTHDLLGSMESLLDNNQDVSDLAQWLVTVHKGNFEDLLDVAQDMEYTYILKLI